MAKTATPKIGLRSAQRRVLRFGMVSVGISMAPALDDSARVSGKMLDPDSLTPLKQQYVNEAGDVIEYADRVKGYAYGESFITLDEDEVPKADSDDLIELVANVPAGDVPSEWIDKTYLAWPQDTTQDQGYALVSHYLRSYGRAFIGTTVANGTTKVLALRWSDTYGTVIAQLLAYHAQVRWGNVEIVKAGLAAIPDPDPAMAKMAAQVFESAPDSFAWDEVEDEYGEALAAAIQQKGLSGHVTPSQATPAPQATDLMAALAASLPASASKATKSTKKVTA